MTPSRLLLVLSIVGLCAATPRASASQIISLTVDGEEPCPTREAIVTTLAGLIPDARLGTPDDSPNAALRIHVEDLGGAYRVALGLTLRTVDEPERRCEERARALALMIAMRLSATSAIATSAREREPDTERAPLVSLESLAPLRRSAFRRRGAGKALVALGVVHMTASLATALAFAFGGIGTTEKYGPDDGGLGAVLLASTATTAALGGVFLGAGIPTWARASHDLEITSDPDRFLRAQAASREPAFIARRTALGHRLLRAGGAVLSLSLAAGTMWLWAYSRPRDFPDGVAQAMGTLALSASATSIGLFAGGGHLLTKSEQRAPRIAFGPGGLAGVFD